ncbi:MAG: hypothetical protein NC204_06000 [Candidatus Amulumruptor caecigallinarius]|nr:hypothetical protein [Candidatus Amulumruptor caecigallinarius]
MSISKFEEAEKDFQKYPFYIYPSIEALAEASSEQRLVLARRIAANIGDETVLRTVTGIDPVEFAGFYPDLSPTSLSTDETISSFLARFSTPGTEETPEIDRIVSAPAVDYAYSMMQNEDDADEEENHPEENDATSDAISTFLKAVPPKTPARRKPALSEELLKIMIKNRNYSKALEIINELSLNNPKKSIYFADQTRFLKKLIQNQERIAKTKGGNL